jgi:predicted nucleic acid-binding Zn ribbon protein
MDNIKDKVQYAYTVLARHQDKCGMLNVFMKEDEQFIECERCGMVVKRGDNSALFQLKGYQIELI